MKYTYLIINEDINSGLLKSQVIQPIKSLDNDDVSVINIHKLGNKNQSFENSVNLPIALPYRIFLFNFLFFLTPVFAFLYAIVLSFFLDKKTVIISRSYFPSLVALFLNKIKKNKYIFDTRSLFIDESTLSGAIKINSLNYKMWRYFEIKILKNSYKTTAVSLKQQEFYENICSGVQVELIPCYVMPIEKIEKDKQSELRAELGFSNEDIIICYYGSLDNGWNNIDMYSQFFKECLSLDYKILIISQNYNSLIEDDRINGKNIVLLNTNNRENEELLNYLSISDYGVVLMRKSSDWETRLSVKFVEYLNIGLQVIVGEFVGEAARYAKEEFPHRTLVYSSLTDLQNFQSKKDYEDNKIDNLFGYSNLKKIIE